MIERNAVFQTTIDSEVMAVLINALSDGDILKGVMRACPYIAHKISPDSVKRASFAGDNIVAIDCP